MKGRELKKKILELIERDDFESSLEAICRLPVRQAINPLFSFLHNADELIRWRSITVMGAMVCRLAESDLESARVVMRRLIWNLNDESGGIGWGSPEAMGEIMARHGELANEYHKILISYIMPDGNYIEHEILQRGVLWGIGRLAHTRPSLVKTAVNLLYPYMESHDPALRGLAAWTAGIFKSDATHAMLKRLQKDQAKLTICLDGQLKAVTVSQLAGIGTLF